MYTDCMVSKKALRIASMKRRSALSSGERTLASLKICQRLCDELDWKKIHRVNVYKALKSLHEADPVGMVECIKSTHPDVDVVISPFALNAAKPDGDFDVVVVPLVAFDEQCNRIGMGGGWYDEYLAGHPSSVKVGIGFEIQKVDEIPISPIDVPMDMIVTDTAVYRP